MPTGVYIRKRRPLADRFWEKVRKDGPVMPGMTTACWPWTAGRHCAFGYGAINVDGKAVSSHVVAYRLTKGEVPDGLFVLHACNNPECCNPEHLRVGTQVDNMADRSAAGRQWLQRNPELANGELNSNAKLTDEKVIAILRRLKEGTAHRDVAAEFGIGQAQVSRIGAGLRWRHVVERFRAENP